MADNPASTSAKASGSFLSKKVAGIPVWVLCAAGGVGLYLYRQQSNNAAAAANAASTTSTVPTIDSTYAGPPEAAGQPISITYSGPTGSTPTAPGYAPTKLGGVGSKTGTIYAFVGKDGGGLAKKLMAQGYSIYTKGTDGTYQRVTRANLHHIKPGTDLYRIGAEEATGNSTGS